MAQHHPPHLPGVVDVTIVSFTNLLLRMNMLQAG